MEYWNNHGCVLPSIPEDGELPTLPEDMLLLQSKPTKDVTPSLFTILPDFANYGGDAYTFYDALEEHDDEDCQVDGDGDGFDYGYGPTISMGNMVEHEFMASAFRMVDEAHESRIEPLVHDTIMGMTDHMVVSN